MTRSSTDSAGAEAPIARLMWPRRDGGAVDKPDVPRRRVRVGRIEDRKNDDGRGAERAPLRQQATPGPERRVSEPDLASSDSLQPLVQHLSDEVAGLRSVVEQLVHQLANGLPSSGTTVAPDLVSALDDVRAELASLRRRISLRAPEATP